MKLPSKHCTQEHRSPLILKPFLKFVHPRFGAVTIESHPMGLPMRHAITHGGRTVAGAFSSSLMGRTIPWQSFNERDLYRHLEFEFACRGYLAQPHVMKWVCSGIPHIYYPDVIAEFYRPIVLECKKDHPTANSYEATKYRMAGEIYRSIGWDFEIVTGANLNRNIIKQLNHLRLIRNQFVDFDLSHELLVREHMIANGNIMMFRTLAERLTGAFNISVEAAEAIVLAMAARRIVRFNLETRITSVSPVQLCPRPVGMTIINFWEKAND